MEDRWHSPEPDAERGRALELLKRHGRGATSFQILERGNQYAFGEDWVIAFVEVAGRRVVAGAPICAPERLAEVVQRFSEAGPPVVFFGVGADFVEALRGAGVAHEALKIAEQADFDAQAHTLEGAARRSLRAQVQRARNKGVRIRRIGPEEIERAPGSLRAEIEQVLDQWLASRRMSVMRFMVDLEPFTFPHSRRYYVAELGSRPVGFLAAIPVYARKGWFLEDVIRVPDAPNGTAELLIQTALEDAKDRGETYVTLGMAPLSGVETGPGPHPWIRKGLKLFYQHSGPLYAFDGVRAFKHRFRPQAWTEQFLVSTPGGIGARSFHAVLRAFAGRGLLGFGLDTARRMLGRVPAKAWAAALTIMAVMLVPWTLLLWAADGERWFGDPSIQYAWVVFDALMVVALLTLARVVGRARPMAPAMAMFLSGATLTDLCLSAVQAFHLHQGVGGWAALFVTAGLAGPLICTLLLWVIAVVLPRRAEPGRRLRP